MNQAQRYSARRRRCALCHISNLRHMTRLYNDMLAIAGVDAIAAGSGSHAARSERGDGFHEHGVVIDRARQDNRALDAADNLL
jgi:hypothetical protein